MSRRARQVGAHIVSTYTIKQGSRLDETYAAFQYWDLDLNQDENLDRLRATNAIGASSASMLTEVTKVLRRRFDTDGRDRPLVTLAQRGCPMNVWAPAWLWHVTRDEFLLRDFLESWLYERYRDGALRLYSSDLGPYLEGVQARSDVETGKTPWSDRTNADVASMLLRIAGDVGLLQGSVVREFAPYRLPDPALIYLLHALSEREGNARNLLDASDWRMVLMSPADVEREVLRLHQYRALSFQAAGSIAQLDLPAPSLAAFAQQMTW